MSPPRLMHANRGGPEPGPVRALLLTCRRLHGVAQPGPDEGLQGGHGMHRRFRRIRLPCTAEHVLLRRRSNGRRHVPQPLGARPELLHWSACPASLAFDLFGVLMLSRVTLRARPPTHLKA